MPTRSPRPISPEASYPAHYRQHEVARILRAVRGRYSMLICGIGGIGKSHLLRFLSFHAAIAEQLGQRAVLRLYLDCNAALDDDAAGIFRALLIEAGSEPPASREATSTLATLRSLLATQIGDDTAVLIVLDRFERIPTHVQPAVLDGLRHLRDYLGRRVSYLLGCRTPPPIAELSGEFDDLLSAPSVLWVGPLSAEDAAWSVAFQLQEQHVAASASLVSALVEISGGHPRLLRAIVMAWADNPGEMPQVPALLSHQQVRRVCEGIWRDLGAAQEPVRYSVSGAMPALAPEHPLLLAGIVRPDRRGPSSVFSPLFAAFVAGITRPAQLDLTALETRLWALLREQPGALLTRDELIDALYGANPGDINDEALTALIARLRRKLQQAGLGAIETVRGLGYRFVPDRNP